jgi:hypothetical protein
MYIILPMYLFFIWHLDSIILMLANPLLGPLEGEGGGPKNLYFFGPKWHSLPSLPIQGPKETRLSGPTPLQLAFVTNVAHIKIITYINNRYINN